MFLPHVVEALQERYRFARIPSQYEELDARKGIAFLHGLFGGVDTQITVDALRIFDNGLAAESRATVELTETFLDDLIEWSLNYFELKLLDPVLPDRFFESALEIEMERFFPDLQERYRDTVDQLTSMMIGYGMPELACYDISSITLHCDATRVVGLKPTAFTVERRAEHPFDAAIFFSSAPVKTADHIKLLEALDAA